MEQNEYEVGKVYPKFDGTRWIFLGYYLEMPVWKVEGKYQTENNIGEVNLPDRSQSFFEIPVLWKKIFLHQSYNLRLFIKRIKG